MIRVIIAAMTLAGTSYVAGWQSQPLVQTPRPAAVAGAMGHTCTDCDAMTAPTPMADTKPAATAAAATGPAVDVKNTKCLVSGEDTDSMGGAVSVTYNGKTYHFCCKDCVKEFNDDPEKYVKKLNDDAEKYGVKK